MIQGVYAIQRDILVPLTGDILPIGEKSDSLESFVESRIRKNRFKTPLVLEEPYDFNVEVSKQLDSGPYFPQFDYMTAFKFLCDCESGTFLVRDKENDKDSKVVMLKLDDEIKTFQLAVGPPPLYGYDCEGKWYPDYSTFQFENRSILKKEFALSLEQAEELGSAVAPAKDWIPAKAAVWKTELFAGYRRLLDSKEKPLNDLLVQAFETGEFEIVKWLAAQGGAIDRLESLARTPGQKAQLEWLKRFFARPDPTPLSLDHYALDVGYGYKTANLLVQERAAGELNQLLTASRAEVPAFLPFSDFEMRQHLQEKIPVLNELWDRFLGTFDPEFRKNYLDRQQDAILADLKISPAGLALLQELQQVIVSHFEERPFHTPELEDWVKQHPSDFLIIRSTGKEDTEENPNPGGNLTIPYVSPREDISRAIGKVVASYFGVKSVTQRLMAGDVSLFQEQPFMPVLVMNMVTEKVNGENDPLKIPRSGVMFTRQKGKAEGVSLLQVGLGNNEGVVASRVAVDTYYIDRDGQIYSIVRDKKTRFVPIQKSEGGQVELEPVYNESRPLETAQGLPDPLIRDMKRCADFFAEQYRKKDQIEPAAMDMEYTIELAAEGGRPIIHLLQIRPLVEKETLSPSYLNLSGLSQFPAEHKTIVKTLIGGDSSVAEISSPEDVMFVDNLTQGLYRYLKSAYQTVKVRPPEAKHLAPRLPKVIFTSKTAHLTSHEAIFFRKQGVKIFVVDDPLQMEKIKGWTDRAAEGSMVLADVQRGQIVSGVGASGKEGLIMSGLISYPIPRELTLPKGMFNPISPEMQEAEVRFKLNLLAQKAQKLFGRLLPGSLTGVESLPSIRHLLDIAAISSDTREAEWAIGMILKSLQKDLAASVKNTENFRNTVNIPLLQLFDAALSLAEERIIPTLGLPPGHPSRLMPIKFLDALIFQEPSSVIIGCESWKSVKQMDKQERAAIKAIEARGGALDEALGDLQVQLQKVGDAALSQKMRANWTDFTQELVAAGRDNPDVLALAALLVKEVVSLDMASSWISLVFNPAWVESAPSKTRGVQLLKDLVRSYSEDKETLQWVAKERRRLLQVREEIAGWNEPRSIRKGIMPLRNLYGNTFGFFSRRGPAPFVERYRASNKMGRLALLEFYREATDLYDRAMKAVSGCRDYPEDGIERARDFSRMIIGFYRMLQGTIPLISKKDEQEMMHVEWEDVGISFDRYLRELEQGTSENFLQQGSPGLVELFNRAREGAGDLNSLFLCRSEFNVEAMAIGSHADYTFSVSRPRTLEEYFTTIHQNLERVRKHLITKEGLSTEDLEGPIVPIAGFVSKVFRQNPSSISLQGRTLILRYDIPLRQHSCSVELQTHLDKPDEGVTIRGMTFGQNEYSRWDKAAGYAAFFGNLEDNPVALSRDKPIEIDYQDPKGCAFTYRIAPSENFLPVHTLIQQFKEIFRTISFANNENTASLVSQMEDHLPSFDWKHVNEKFFEDALFFDAFIMQRLSERKDNQVLLKAAEGTFKGLLKYGLDDYFKGADVPQIPGLSNDPSYAFIPGNDGTLAKSAKLAATLCLVQGLRENWEGAGDVVQELLASTGFRKTFPETAKALEYALKDPNSSRRQFDF